MFPRCWILIVLVSALAMLATSSAKPLSVDLDTEPIDLDLGDLVGTANTANSTNNAEILHRRGNGRRRRIATSTQICYQNRQRKRCCGCDDGFNAIVDRYNRNCRLARYGNNHGRRATDTLKVVLCIQDKCNKKFNLCSMPHHAHRPHSHRRGRVLLVDGASSGMGATASKAQRGNTDAQLDELLDDRGSTATGWNCG